jgi:hypothetical protein
MQQTPTWDWVESSLLREASFMTPLTLHAILFPSRLDCRPREIVSMWWSWLMPKVKDH